MTEYKAERILPYQREEKKGIQVRDMFDAIAKDYDRLNRIMTFGGIDKIWRKTAIRLVGEKKPRRILDVATGTGDLALYIHKSLNPEHITGIDLSEEMLSIARTKAKHAGVAEKITFECQDCLNLSFSDASFDAVTVAFGVRNFENIQQGIDEMFRVLAPNGILMVLELSTPEKFPFKQFYRIYSGYVIPLLGKLFSKDKTAYQYLPRSIAAVPQGDKMLQIFRNAGFENTRCMALTFGSCSIYLGEKR